MKLNQIIALVAGKKTKAQKLLTTVHHGWHKDRITGITRTYTPKDEDGEVFPPESRIVQLRVGTALKVVQKEIEDFLNIVATQEYANTSAKADIVIDDETILSDVPVSALLFLEKQLIGLRTLASNLPTLPTDRVWKEDEAKNCWVTEPEETVKTQKKAEVIVKYDATPEHPAQTDLIHVDRTIGHWKTVHLSGALPEAERDAMVERIEKLQDAVKVAREKANSQEVVMQYSFGKSVLDYILTSE
ncbi:MAG: DUF7873 family protein [Planctomycetota bacterium]|jgi:hypothetical protein